MASGHGAHWVGEAPRGGHLCERNSALPHLFPLFLGDSSRPVSHQRQPGAVMSPGMIMIPPAGVLCRLFPGRAGSHGGRCSPLPHGHAHHGRRAGVPDPGLGRSQVSQSTTLCFPPCRSWRCTRPPPRPPLLGPAHSSLGPPLPASRPPSQPIAGLTLLLLASGWGCRPILSPLRALPQTQSLAAPGGP